MNLNYKLEKALKSNNLNEIHSVFEEIYISYGKLVNYVILKYVNKKEDAADLTQEVFVCFFNGLEKKKIKNIKYYLITSAKNTAFNFLKKEKNVQPLDDLTVSIDDCIFSEIEDIIEKFKKYITEYEIEIIYLHSVYGLKFYEIAEIKGKSLSTILSTYRRAVKKLKGGLKNE